MTDGASGSAPRRPATARPRSDQAAEEGAQPPTRAELEAIERQQVEWSTLLGAEVTWDDAFGAVFIRDADPGPASNLATRIRWPSEDVGPRLAALETRMRATGHWPSLIVNEGLTEPADLADRLNAAGWTRLGSQQIMVTRHAPVVPHIDPGLRLEAVTPASALELVTLESEAFGLPLRGLEQRAQQLAVAVESGAVRGFLLRLVHEPVASARLAPGPGVAGLHGIAVAARHRRRGYGRMITAVATRGGLAVARGLVWLSVEPANVAAVELYRSLGYSLASEWSRWAAPSR